MKYNRGFSKIVIMVIIAVVLIAAGAEYYMIKNPKIIWDGTYRVTGSMSCTGNIPQMPSAIPIDENLSVVNNAALDTAGNFGPAGKTYPIDNKAQVTLTVNQSNNNQGVTQAVNGRMSFQFYKEGDALKVRSNYSTDITIAKGEQNYSGHCAGDVSGIKL